MKLSPQFLKFCLVGVINTTVDALIFVTLREFGMPIILANICSTSVALAGSLALNYRFVFKDSHLSAKKIILYIVVTLLGLWALQPVVIYGLLEVNDTVNYVSPFVKLFGNESIFMNLLPKLGSVVVTLLWNYAWYNKVIFKPATPQK